MIRHSKIEWTESSWNPVTGCTKLSDGCLNCYAERMARRLRAMGQPNYTNGFTVTCHPKAVELPLGWKKSQMIFVNSMSDLFHDAVPSKFIEEVFLTMNQAPQHCFQILTKRANRLAELAPRLNWTPNIWMGVTVEKAKYKDRIDALRTVPATIRFLSIEPLLGPIPDLDLRNIDWVIVGGESGAGARRMNPEWVTDIRDQCLNASVAFFFKQWGGVRKKAAGRELDGRIWSEMPAMKMQYSGSI
jgi:protein gp37